MNGKISKITVTYTLVVALLLTSGIAYRVLQAMQGDIEPVILPVALSEFPMNIDDWHGREAPISASEEKAAGCDDYISRRYSNDRTNQRASLYVAYTASPRTMLGHRPQVCMPSAGWEHEKTEKSEFVTISGIKIPCLVHRFYKPSPSTDISIVLNYYILNGNYTNDDDEFDSIGFRTPNIDGNIARYVTKVQMSARTEDSVRALAVDLAETIMTYFPDKNGVVEIVKSK